MKGSSRGDDMDFYLTAKILLTLVALAQAIGPMRADFNRTHATNPKWTPHARFHVVWQVLQQTMVSGFVLLLLWVFPSTLHTAIAAAMVLSWSFTFLMTLASMPLFEGTMADDNGIPPFRFPLPGGTVVVDTNLFGALVLGALSLIAVVLLLVA